MEWQKFSDLMPVGYFLPSVQLIQTLGLLTKEMLHIKRYVIWGKIVLYLRIYK